MFREMKGKLTAASFRRFNKFPSAEKQALLKLAGWDFHTIEGPTCEPPVYVVLHPDGKPLEGYGAPGYVFGRDGSYIQEDMQALCEKRWRDFAKACAMKDPTQLKLRPPPVRKETPLPAPAVLQEKPRPLDLSFTI